MGQHVFQTFGEMAVLLAEHVAQQHPDRLGAFRREIRDIRCDQFPCDIGQVRMGQEMNAFRQHVMREDQRLPAEFQHRRVVGQSAR